MEKNMQSEMGRVYEEFGEAHLALREARERMREAEGGLREAREAYLIAEARLSGRPLASRRNGHHAVRVCPVPVLEVPELG